MISVYNSAPYQKKSPGRNEAKELLLVCGFLGFDDKRNRRPTFGARLVCVDGISVEREQWKMANYVDHICRMTGPTQMSFKNEFLTTAQISQLKTTDMPK